MTPQHNAVCRRRALEVSGWSSGTGPTWGPAATAWKFLCQEEWGPEATRSPLARPATASRQHSSPRHPLGLRCSHPPLSPQTHAGDMGTSRTWGWRQPRAHVHRSTRARSTALGPHPQVRSLCPEGQQETGQPGRPQQVNLRCRPLGSGRGRTAPSGEDACRLWELLLACSWASAETTRT